MFKKLFVLFALIWPGCYSSLKINEPMLIAGPSENVPFSQFVVSIAEVNAYGTVNYCRGHRCAGIIIGPSTILTAAQCVYGKRKELIYVIAGSTKLHNATYTRQAIQVKHIVIHPLYKHNGDKSKNDIALVDLTKKLIEYPGIVEVYTEFPCSSTRSELGTKCTRLGWGAKKIINNRVQRECDVLTNTDLVITKTEECEKHYKFVADSTGYNMCAAVSKEGRKEGGYLPEGDLGPIFCRGILYGVSGSSISFNSFLPTYFTNVCDYAVWIKYNSLDTVNFRTSAAKKLNYNIYFKIFSIIIFIMYIYV